MREWILPSGEATREEGIPFILKARMREREGSWYILGMRSCRLFRLRKE